jgi:hypothetical protein
MSETPISPLRARMIEDMNLRRFGEKTQKDYIRHVKTFSTFLGRSPATATAEDLRRFQVHQSKASLGASTINSSVAALRFFFRVTLDRPDMGRYLTVVPLPERLRTVLSQEEVARLLEAAPGVKYKAALGVAYGAGLRVAEVANLKVSDIDSQRMLLRVLCPSPGSIPHDVQRHLFDNPLFPAAGTPIFVVRPPVLARNRQSSAENHAPAHPTAVSSLSKRLRRSSRSTTAAPAAPAKFP